MRVFVGPVEISGIAVTLVGGLRALQVDAKAVFGFAHPFNYGDQYLTWLIGIWQRIGLARSANIRANLMLKLMLLAAHKLWGFIVFFQAIPRFDAFIFIFGQTITNSAFELWLLNRLGKKIIFIYVGSDSRPPYMDGGAFPGRVADDLPSPATLLRRVIRRKRRLRLHERYANYLVNSPATAHFHERPYINWFSMGIPRALPVSPNINLPRNDNLGLVRVLHAPSSPLVKGTTEIIEVLTRLRKKGYKIELVEIQGMPNEVVLQEIARCDFIVDQLYSDTPMAAFAAEAAMFGKPAVVGGYFAEEINKSLEHSGIPPSLFVEPEDLERAIERLIVDSDFRLRLGEQARDFVFNHWSPMIVAGRYLKLLNDDIPSDWWCDPDKVRYLSGGGLPRGRSKMLVGLLLKHFGVKALQVQDKPGLERDLVEFAGLGVKSADA